ncbi:MAG: 50S ribosomal protein L11 methyltransferase [Phyllobacteriaceae bacterium]|nr:50S ribosomal protein L11 methyltransferase [Phyllobacteriaceae bacterium]
MPQIKLSMVGGKAEIARVHRFIEDEFDDDGLPVSFSEINEDDDLFEAALYVDSADVEQAEARIRNRIGADAFGLRITHETMPDIDWVAHSLDGLNPVRVGRVVVHGAHDSATVLPNEIGIQIEAAQAFGTGHHGTTAGCLDMLQRVTKARAPRAMLDLGTGSAVLALALARLTNRPVLATDNDPLAITIARDNAALNGCAHLVRFAVAEGFACDAIRRAAPFDLIVANILAGPLMQLAPHMRSFSTIGADVILSGILDRQAARVQAAYVANGFALRGQTRREGWTTLHFTRR